MERAAETGVRFAQPRCPYCHDEIPSGSPQLACNTCRAWHHQPCWAEAGQRCAACGSQATGFLSADQALPGQPERLRDPATEFRFRCPHCKEAMWAARTTVGRTGVCPSCKRDTTVPEVGSTQGLVVGTWQSDLTDLLIGASAIALVIAAGVWFVGLLVGAFRDEPGVAGTAFRYGFSVPYLLGLFVSLFSSGEGRDPPRKRIVACGLLGIASFFGAWALDANAWVLAALLPPWPVFLLGWLLAPDGPPTPPPAPGQAPWQGE
ncbi:MAG: hypothetical protein KDD82_00800 [Planctomycetes bacterium]|nr:hypothetical protein [Planctomycetota bacterium]